MTVNIIHHDTNDVLHSVSFNQFVVFEIFEDRIESFVYLLEYTNWKNVVDFHRSRPGKKIFSPIQVREVGHIYDHFLKRIHPVINELISHGVKQHEILFITNYHTLLDLKKVRKYFGHKINIEFLRFFEIDAVLQHRNIQHQNVNTIFDFKNKYLAMFGKTRKFMRSGALIKMYDNNMYKESLISSLAKGVEIDASVNYASQYWPARKLHKVLTKFSQSIDNVVHDSDGGSEISYMGYPYDKTVYETTFCSIIPETNDIIYDNNPATVQFFITEKFARAVFNYHPFVILGTPYFLKNIKELGYKTFDTFICEKYDEEENPYTRLDMAINSIKDMPVEKNDMLLNILIHNCENMINVYNNEYNKLCNFLNKI
jgi:hypothetical protein